MKGPKDSTPAAAFEIHPKQNFFVFFGSPRGVIMVPKLMKPQIDTSKLGPPIRGGTWVGGFGPLDPPPPPWVWGATWVNPNRLETVVQKIVRKKSFARFRVVLAVFGPRGG